MSKTEILTTRLKNLRERSNITAKELAKRSGMHISLIYKAENPNESVKAQSLWNAYRPLCLNDEEWYDVLMRWALVSCREFDCSIYKGALAMESLREEAAGGTREKIVRIASAVDRVADADLPLLEKGIREFARNEHARSMVQTWLNALKDSNQ